MQPHQLDALVLLSGRLDAAGVPFLLGGSALLHALGLPVDVGDLDLMCRVEDHDALRAAVGGWWQDSTTAGTGLWASAWFARLDVTGVDVDAIGGMALREGGRVVTLPFRDAGTWQVGDRRVRLAAPELWWAAYRQYQPAKAQLLARIVPPAARRAVREELGL